MKPVALITGGMRGIGRGIVDELARDHAVATTYRNSPPDAVLAAWPETLAIETDLGAPESAEQIIADVIRHFGRIDLIVNNAGSLLSDAEDHGENLAINVTAAMALVDAALPHLKRGANIINISSVNADLPAMGAISYSASKAAINTWTRGLAKTLGPEGIRVNGIAPGAIERVEKPRDPELLQKFVDMTALGRHGLPKDIAGVVRFLASDAASFITGETITVSGGYRL